MKIKNKVRNTVRWAGGMKCVGEDESGHLIPMEASPRFGGSGEAPHPLQLLLSSLGGCVALHFLDLLRRQGKAYASFEVQTEGIRREELPKTFEKLHVKVLLSGDLDEELVEDTLRHVMTKECPIAVILGATCEMKWEYELVKTPK